VGIQTTYDAGRQDTASNYRSRQGAWIGSGLVIAATTLPESPAEYEAKKHAILGHTSIHDETPEIRTPQIRAPRYAKQGQQTGRSGLTERLLSNTPRPQRRFGRVPALIEWDDHVPELERLLEESRRAREVEAEVLG